MKTAVVVTVGSRAESLGAMKLARYLKRLGYAVEERAAVRPGIPAVMPLTDRFDLYCFSVVFSWRLRDLIEMVNGIKDYGEVWIGGPAVSFHPANSALVERETGIAPTRGIDERFEREPGQYPMTYFSRGCPAYTPACGLCPVPRIEGNEFRYYPDSKPAPMLLDNNLSALPDDYQDLIIRRYAEDWRGARVDANSGFEPHTFNDATLRRWLKFPLLYWRFGYDDLTERDQALEMMARLRAAGLEGQRVRVYTMIGNESREDSERRIKEVIAAGFHPWPQRRRPLDWLGPDGTLPTLFDWDEPTLIATQRFYSNAALWKTMKPEEFFYQGRYPFAEGRI